MKILKALFGKPKPIAKVVAGFVTPSKPKATPSRVEVSSKQSKFEYAGSLLDDDEKGYFLEPEESYDLDIVGEASYQAALESLAGPRTEEGVSFECNAVLYCENENKYDKNAVCVKIQGLPVGYLSKADAKEWRKMLRTEKAKEATVRVRALIVGGWLANDKKGVSQGHFGVKLDVPVET